MSARTRKIEILDMDTQGKITEREVLPGSEMWLDNTVAGRLYPNLQLALITVPTEILEWDEATLVADGLYNIEFKGTRYRLVGSGGGAKNGKFYFADVEHAILLHNRFQNWPEALITYFGIQTSDCRRILEAEGKILIVPDNELGTNDCRGWISEKLFAGLDAPSGAFYQFRLGFEGVNGKGSFKVMKDDVAQALGADIVIPESSCKPAALGLKPWNYYKRAARTYSGPFVVGLREISRDLVFASSYTVAQHASAATIEHELVPKARIALAELKQAWVSGNHEKLVQQIGSKVSLDGFNSNEDEELTMRAVEAALLADGSGEICQHPYIYRQVDKLLARWAYKLLTGGGLHLPGFALADDGYLFLNAQGSVVSGSDWVPQELAITSLASDRSLCVRYPVRMKEDLLPMNNCSRERATQLLIENGLTGEEAAFVVNEQLFLQGTYTLHSKTAKKNGGDYDFDQVCVIDEALYPMFVADRFSFESSYVVTKTKADRLKSPMYSLEHVALKSMGNQIGVITDTISSCIASARMEEMYELVGELQKEIDSLKHNTRADLSKIKEIKELAPKAPWLSLKDVQRVSSLTHLDVLPTDKIGKMYNMLRTDLVEMMAAPMEIRQFQGLLVGNTPSKEMLEECRTVFHAVSTGHKMLRVVSESIEKQVEAATVAFKAATASGEQETLRIARKALAKARSQQRVREEKHKEQSANLIGIAAAWGKSKVENRKAWAQALHTVVSGGKGTGSLLFQVFPQEAIDAMAERTGGIRSIVVPNRVAGVAFIENNTFFTQASLSAQPVAKFHYDAEKRRLVKPYSVN